MSAVAVASSVTQKAVSAGRRRTPAGGASDDCFACAKRNVRCDRKRPYCSQCLETGKACAGYKTQLTWGVGVASRGKLRGRSLPIAKAPAGGGSMGSGLHSLPRQVRNGLIVSSSPSVENQPRHGTTSSDAAAFPVCHQPKQTSATAWSPGKFQCPVDHLNSLAPLGGPFPRHEMVHLDNPKALCDGFPNHGMAVPHSPMAPGRLVCGSVSEAQSAGSGRLLSGSHRLITDSDASVHLHTAKWRSRSVTPAQTAASQISKATAPEPALWFSAQQALRPHAAAPELVAKMPFLVSYYEHAMCPSMVFVDGADNPFRRHVLQLATNSSSLQHAICALAALNQRMKLELGLGEKRLGPENQCLVEEYQHRNLAVSLLNEQLHDADRATHDSVLASLLLLVLYRMAKSGLAKIPAQFAGVKLILEMRRKKRQSQSRDAVWMEALFAHFDAISASVNDREAQLDAALYKKLPGGENLVGCDRELLPIIGKLGRLNLLSQNRPVQGLECASPTGHAADEHRPSFWHEWKEARTALQLWNFDSSRVVAMLTATNCNPTESDGNRWTGSLHCPPPAVLDAQTRDLHSVSEAFRYAALLYTERLSSPNLSSAHSPFCNLVGQVIFWASSIEPCSGADKFLLWPLFVAGSECINELQQVFVRSKCRDIMQWSGYMNNPAALDVLETIWAGQGGGGQGGGESFGRGGAGDAAASGNHHGVDLSEPVFIGELPLAVPSKGPPHWTRCIGGNWSDEWIMF